jgi:hypothetical protein
MKDKLCMYCQWYQIPEVCYLSALIPRDYARRDSDKEGCDRFSPITDWLYIERLEKENKRLSNIFSLSLNPKGHTLFFHADNVFPDLSREDLSFIKKIKVLANEKIFRYSLVSIDESFEVKEITEETKDCTTCFYGAYNRTEASDIALCFACTSNNNYKNWKPLGETE